MLQKISEPGNKNVLMTYISGLAVEMMRHRTEDQIVFLCVQTLRKMFPDKVIPPPLSAFVTRWQQDAYAGMAYTFVPVGSSGQVYDILAEHINNRVFFAGEVCAVNNEILYNRKSSLLFLQVMTTTPLC